MAGSATQLDERLIGYAGAVPFDLAVSVMRPVNVAAGDRTTLSRGTVDLGIGPGRRGGALPMVSCLMVTRNRLHQAQLAVSCYRRQTWPARELVVLDESDDGRLAAWIAGLCDPSIRVIPIRGPRRILGDLRNQSVECAAGAFICQWDDDDLQHPARIEIAMAAMAATRAPASVLAREMMWLPARRRLTVLHMRPHENSLIAARTIMPRYPVLNRGEDTPVVEALFRSGQVVLIDRPELYVYVAHGANTWDETHMEEIWGRSLADSREGISAETILALFARTLPINEYRALLAATGGGDLAATA